MKKILIIALLAVAALSSLASNDTDDVKLVIHLSNLEDSLRYCSLLGDKDICECFSHKFVKTDDPSMNYVAHVYCGGEMMGQLYGKGYKKDFLMMIHQHATCAREDMERVRTSHQKRAQMNE